MIKNVNGANPSKNIESTFKSLNFDSRSNEIEEDDGLIPIWNKSYTLVLLLNVMYIVVFFIIMKIFT